MESRTFMGHVFPHPGTAMSCGTGAESGGEPQRADSTGMAGGRHNAIPTRFLRRGRTPALRERHPQTSFVLTDSLLDAAGYHESGYLDVRLRRACSYMASSYHTLVWSPWSAPRRFYHQRGVEGMEGVALPELTVSPNPATGVLHVEGEAGALQLLDLQGREMKVCDLRGVRITMDVSNLPRGVYLLRLVTDTSTASRRVVLL